MTQIVLSVKEKALLLRNFSLVIMGPLIVYAVSLGDDVAMRVVLFIGWVTAVLLSCWGYSSVRNGSISARMAAFYTRYNPPKPLLSLKLHRFWAGSGARGE